MNSIIVGDCIDEMKLLPENSVDAIVTDPPYGLGFMGKTWDIHTPLDFERFTEAWATECLRILKPGGHMLAFGGSRTWHRLAAGIEDAGFELRDSIVWLYGTGFPKSMDVSKAIDKAAGAEREKVRKPGAASAYSANAGNDRPWMQKAREDGFIEVDGDIPATDAAREWEGWGTALKPAFEPVLWARKPFNVVSLVNYDMNRLHHLIGTLLWLSLSHARRAEVTSKLKKAERYEVTCASALASAAMDTSHVKSAKTDTYRSQELGSTLSNIVSSWSAILDALSRPTRTFTTETKSNMTTASRILSSLLDPGTSPSTMPACACLLDGLQSNAQNADESSRGAWEKWLHTQNATVPETAIEGIALAVESVLAHAAVSLSGGPEAASSAESSATPRADENPSPAFEPIVVARKPLGEKTVAANVLKYGTGALNIDATRIGDGTGEPVPEYIPNGKNSVYGNNMGGGSWNNSKGRWPANVVLDEPQAEALDALTDGASRFFYVAKAPKSERPVVDGVAHPTVKPLALMRWLIRLVTPPGGTVLDPFAGSGTTIEAAILEGFDVVGVESEESYIPLINARIARSIGQGD